MCLEHLERQSDQGFEVIIVDDGSSDDTPLFLDLFQEFSPLDLVILRQPNLRFKISTQPAEGWLSTAR